MHWLLAFIGVVIASGLNENIFLWGIVGYLTGFALRISGQISRLEKKVNQIHNELVSSKNTDTSIQQETEENIFSEPGAESAPVNEQETPSTFDPVESQLSTLLQQEELTETLSDNENTNPWVQESIRLNTEDSLKHSSEPSDIQKLIGMIINWFTDGNTFVRIGIVILFIGVSFLLNFAIDRGMISIELRLAAVAAAAIALLFTGWKLKLEKTDYALLIQGGGVGLLYLTIFASFSLYNVIPSLPAFTLLVLVVVLSTSLAILQDALALALFAAIGGFLAPILTSTGSNNYIGLFSFYSLLNAGILAVAWFKSWRILNLIGFVFTFSISTFWGATRYQPDFFSTTEPFLILFFLFYVGIAILYATRRAPELKNYIDGTLIFGTPILAFGLQAAMVNQYEYGVAISAFSLAVFYLVLANFLWQRLGDELKLLSETFVSICVIFATLTIPFAVDDSTTSAAWAIEGTGVLWISIRQQQFIRRVFALLLQVCAGLMLLYDGTVENSVAFLNSTFIGAVLIAICAGLSSWMLYQPFTKRRDFERQLSPWLLVYSLLWLFSSFEYQIYSHNLDKEHAVILLSLTVFITAFFNWLANRLDWLDIRYAALSMLLPMIYATVVTFFISSHPAAYYGWLLWPLSFVIYFKTLKDSSFLSQDTSNTLHLFTGILLALLLFWEGFWQLLLITALLSLLFYKISAYITWPQMRMLAFGLLPVMLLLCITILFTAQMHPLYLPDTRMNIEWPFVAGIILWPLAFAVMYWLFWQEDQQAEALNRLPICHALTLILLVIIPTWEVSWQLSSYLPLDNGWHIALLPITSIAALWLILQARFWPFNSHQDTYLRLAAVPLIWGLAIWSVIALFTAGDSEPLPWLPILNPADLIQVIIILTLARFIALIPAQLLTEINKSDRYKILAGFCFVWLNIVLLRSVHHWGELPWSITLLSTPLAQTSLSIFWAMSGLALTIISNQQQLRKLWITGAILLVIVVLKLFLFDLTAHGTIERIISFITVGALLMLIGYFAPLPAAKEQENAH